MTKYFLTGFFDGQQELIYMGGLIYKNNPVCTTSELHAIEQRDSMNRQWPGHNYTIVTNINQPGLVLCDPYWIIQYNKDIQQIKEES